jgi:hypothetical protein
MTSRGLLKSVVNPPMARSGPVRPDEEATMVKLRASRKRSNTWFYGLLVVFIIAGYLLLQFALFSTSNCNGHREWEWKVPPGFVCAATV